VAGGRRGVDRFLRHRVRVLHVGRFEGLLIMERYAKDRDEWRETFKLIEHAWSQDGVNPYTDVDE
jgi:hypothetical protein